MNYLAHILLSTKDIDYQLGNLLADPLKGRAWKQATPEHIQGMQMHKLIDQFTDSHADVRQSQARLGTGRLRGIVIDIVFDYFVLKHWEQYAMLGSPQFIDTFYAEAQSEIGRLPCQIRGFIERLIHFDVLSSYASLTGVELAFQRFDMRLSPRLRAKETTSQYMPILLERLPEIERDFLRFFPQLIAFFHQQSQAKQTWLK